MNFPTNLLFDIELAKSRLLDAFKPAAGCDDRQKTPALARRMHPGETKTKESSIPPSFRLPEVRGCAGISFQAL